MITPIFRARHRHAATALGLALGLGSCLTVIGCNEAGQPGSPPVRADAVIPASAPVPAASRVAPTALAATVPTTITPMPKRVPDPVSDDGSVADVAESGTGPAAAVATVRRYYAALDRHAYDAAYRLWENDGQASGQTLHGFRQGFARTASTRVTPGPPSSPEGAAGSSYVTVPVTVEATLDDGTRQRFAGRYVLRRVNDVPGASIAARRWHLHSASLEPA